MDPRLGAGGHGGHGDHPPPHGAHGGAGARHPPGHAHPPGTMMLPRLVGGLRCMDVLREMEEQLAILTGGRDRRGAPIMSFHQNPRRERAKPEDYKKLLDYLVGVPW